MAEAKFEEALAKLEEIVRKMEQGELTLDESLASFEEGIRLSRLCARKLDEAERRIDVEWARSSAEAFPVHIVVHTDDRPGVLNQLTSVLAAEECNIRTLDAGSDDGRNGDGAIIEMTVDVKDKKQLEKLVGGMRGISGVRDVERMP
jgi:exodeoxyribonuclease VII small subunit